MVKNLLIMIWNGFEMKAKHGILKKFTFKSTSVYLRSGTILLPNMARQKATKNWYTCRCSESCLMCGATLKKKKKGATSKLPFFSDSEAYFFQLSRIKAFISHVCFNFIAFLLLKWTPKWFFPIRKIKSNSLYLKIMNLKIILTCCGRKFVEFP